MKSSSPDPYVVGLRMLGARELSTTALAERLRRRGFEPADVEDAVARLRDAGALDDDRAARAFARTFQRKGRGQIRVLRDVEAQGIGRDLARQVVAELFATIDESEAIDAILSRRLDGPILDRAHFQRLYRQLVRRGFPSGAAVRALQRHGGSYDVERE